MKGRSLATVVLLIATVAVTAAGVELVHRGSDRQPLIDPSPATSSKTPGVVTFPAGAPELGFVRTMAAEVSSEPVAEPFAGRVAYDEAQTARVTTPIAGRVITIHAQPGGTVKRGDPLISLDAPEYAQAMADARKAEADLRLRQTTLRRAQELYGGGVLARKDLESAESDAAASSAETTRAQARLANLTSFGGSDGFVIRSPIGGRVVDRQVNPGSEVRPDATTPLFLISDISQVWVLFELAERELGKVHIGDRLAVHADAYQGRSYLGIVTQIADALDPQTRRIVVRASLFNADRTLKPEMFVRVALLSAVGPQSIKLPASAIITEGLYSSVFVETAPHAFAKRRVTLGLQTAENVYVREGLRTGEAVVTQGALLLDSELAASD